MSKLDYPLLDSLCDNCNGSYCFLKELLHMNSLYDKRLLVQIKCMEIFKYEIGEKVNKDIGWEETAKQWYEIKYAEYFAQAYDEELKHTGADAKPRAVYRRLKQIALAKT